MKTNNKKQIISLISLLIALCFIAGCRSAATKEQQAKPVKVKTAEHQMTNRPARYAASITPNTQVEVAFKVGGYVVGIEQVRDQSGQWRHIQAGDIVQKGTVLAQLRRDDYQSKVNQTVSQQGEANAGVETSKAQLAEAKAAIDTSRAQLAEAQAALDRAKQDYERAKNLFGTESITKADYDASRAQYESAQARVDAAKSQLETAQSRVKTAQAQISASEARAKTAKVSTADAMIPLGDTSLRAPMSAIVLERKVEVGALVSPNTQGFVLADITSVKATFGVPDMALPNLKMGQTVNIKTDAVSGSEFTGHISRISPSADTSSRVFEVEVSILNSQNQLKPGMIVSLELREGGEPQQMTVAPLSAVTRSKTNAQAYAIFVVEDVNGKTIARQREVTVGETYGNNIVVASGLKTGERVITTGATMVADGDVVQVIP